MGVENKVWNKLFPPKKGDRVKIIKCIYPEEEADLLGKEGVLEIIFTVIPRIRPYGIRLDSKRLVWVEKEEIVRIGEDQ